MLPKTAVCPEYLFEKTGCFGQKSLISCASKVVIVLKEVKSPHCMGF